MERDVIAALATPPGEGAIAVIRVSGNGCISLVERVFRSKYGKSLHEAKSHTLLLGEIVDEDGFAIDEVLVALMRGPRSYTGEDVVEINCHGGKMVSKSCLELLIKNGARLAEPGEFTKRAFINGRLNMTQAEAVIEIIKAKSEQALRLSVRNLKGCLGEALEEIEELLVMVNSRLEAWIDFPEEVTEIDEKEIKRWLGMVKDKVEKILKGAKRNQIFREGARVVIAGKPNVGKSSLLNGLLGKKRAIVTEIPGTTRDVIEEWISIKGIPVKLSDTAGIREAKDVIEKIGIEMTKEILQGADLILLVVDGSRGIDEDDWKVYKDLPEEKTLVVVNKLDLPCVRLTAQDAGEMFRSLGAVGISAKTGMGLDDLEESIWEVLVSKKEVTEEEFMVNRRQEGLLGRVHEHVEEALKSLENGLSWDCVAVDTWGAIEELEEITGKRIREEVVERIFADFCIGK